MIITTTNAALHNFKYQIFSFFFRHLTLYLDMSMKQKRKNTLWLTKCSILQMSTTINTIIYLSRYKLLRIFTPLMPCKPFYKHDENASICRMNVADVYMDNELFCSEISMHIWKCLCLWTFAMLCTKWNFICCVHAMPVPVNNISIFKCCPPVARL